MKALVYFVIGLSVVAVGLAYLMRDGAGPPGDGAGMPASAPRSAEVRVTRGSGHEDDKPGLIDRLFRSVSDTHDSHATPQTTRATSARDGLPRDFTARTQKPSNVRRITVGD